MPEALKLMYSPAFFERIIPVMSRTIKNFDERKFLTLVFNEQWPDFELKQRVRHIAKVLRVFLGDDFSAAAERLTALAKAFRTGNEKSQGFELMFLPEYIYLYGQGHLPESLKAIGEVTKLVSAEFAIRPFLLSYPNETFAQLLNWSLDSESSVRRLSSEGCRPRLPWGDGIRHLVENPGPVFLILENLKNDSSEYVRRSVANNLNDISKDHPEEVLSVLKGWTGLSRETDALIKHACRTLVKRGHPDALSLLGLDCLSKANVRKLQFSPKRVKVGSDLLFDFEFRNAGQQPAPFRIDYSIDYLTSTGKKSRKVFHLAQKTFPQGQWQRIHGKRSFKNFTTRKHFAGIHRFSLLVNGTRMLTRPFEVAR